MNSVEAAKAKAVDFIKKLQTEDGSWQDFLISQVGLSDQWVTGYIGYVLQAQKDTMLCSSKAANWLLNTELSGGGWGYNKENLADADSTANVIRFLSIFSHPTTRNKELLYRWGNFLCSFQDANTGGFITYKIEEDSIFAKSGWCKPEVSVSAMAGLALFGIDREYYKKTLEQVTYYLKKNQLADGSWDSYWWNGNLYGMNLICQFLRQMGEFSCIDKSISWVIDQQTQSGGWGNDSKSQPYPFYTAMAMGILQLNGICKKQIKAGINWLIKSQQTDGGWASTEILKVPNPETNVPPWECRILTSLVQDQQRLYTTASVLQVL